MNLGWERKIKMDFSKVTMKLKEHHLLQKLPMCVW
jgi:hypothetical protein